MTKICVSLATSDTGELKSSIDRTFEIGADFVEIRFDFLSIEDFDEAVKIADTVRKKSVYTLRPANQGGKFLGSERDRVGLLEKLIMQEPMLVDIELDTIEENDSLADFVENSRTPVLISWHDFKGTPPQDRLSDILTRMRRYSTFAKVVTTANSTKDALQVLSLYDYADGLKLIAFAMGRDGIISRVLCTLAGNAPYTYAALETAVAPGQLTLKEMRNLYDRIKLK